MTFPASIGIESRIVGARLSCMSCFQRQGDRNCDSQELGTNGPGGAVVLHFQLDQWHSSHTCGRDEKTAYWTS